MSYVDNDEQNVGHLQHAPQLSPCFKIEFKVTEIGQAVFLTNVTEVLLKVEYIYESNTVL